MPFKSQAQRRKFAALLLSGDITPEQYERWNRETGGRMLPERVKPKRKPKKKPKRKSAGSAKRPRTRPRRTRKTRARSR